MNSVYGLTNKKCVPCRSGVTPLVRKEALFLLKYLKGWTLSPGAKAIRAEYLMKDFMAAVQFINRLAKLAEAENHHPDIHLSGYRRLIVEISTHAIHGLSENDFILAAKIGVLPKSLKESKK